MKAIILAAGKGRRLGTEMPRIPKCLVEINGKSILERQIEILSQYVAADKIIVVTGYKHMMVEKVARKLGVKTIWNPLIFCENIISLFFGITKVKGKFIVLNGDTLVNENTINELTGMKGNVLVVERWKGSENLDDELFYHDYDKEAMKVEFDGKKITNIGKKIGRWEAWGEYIGLAKIEDTKKLYQAAMKLIGDGFVNYWYESIFNAMIVNGVVFRPLVIKGFWNEIDTKEDLENVRKCFV